MFKDTDVANALVLVYNVRSSAQVHRGTPAMRIVAAVVTKAE